MMFLFIISYLGIRQARQVIDVFNPEKYRTAQKYVMINSLLSLHMLTYNKYSFS